MLCGSPDHFDKKSFRIKHEDEKLFKKFLSKESSKSNTSLRVLYYGTVSGAVPFVWETCPGTPKHDAFSPNLDIPPLTPPPAYYYNTKNSKSKHYSRSKLLLHALLRRMSPHKNSHLPSSPKSSSSSISSLSKSSSSNSWISEN